MKNTQIATIIYDLLEGKEINYRMYEVAPHKMNHPPISKAIDRLLGMGIRIDKKGYPRINHETNTTFKVFKIKEKI